MSTITTKDKTSGTGSARSQVVENKNLSAVEKKVVEMRETLKKLTFPLESPGK